ncbi:MAG: hypothetical protein M1825_003581 [Sarcosagium campestre]|nr:MAG: hypothetical protein M1825_003581 [Sarcosagium campestre]
MPPERTRPNIAQASRSIFDPWNSSSTGHQRAENRLAGSTSWRQSRTIKLTSQFGAGNGGGVGRVADTVGAGSEAFGRDGRKPNGDWEAGAPGLREKGWQSVGEMLKRTRSRETSKDTTGAESSEAGEVMKEGDSRMTRSQSRRVDPADSMMIPAATATSSTMISSTSSLASDHPTVRSRLFDSLTFYINGSTAPAISDHRLKHLIAEHGGRIAIGLARRSVTHVVLGQQNGGRAASKGAGGGLAATKIQKEVRRVRGCGVKYIDVEWILESIKAGRRLAEAGFSNLNIGGRGQRSVYGMFKEKKSVVLPESPTTRSSAKRLDYG